MGFQRARALAFRWNQACGGREHERPFLGREVFGLVIGQLDRRGLGVCMEGERDAGECGAGS